MVTDVFPSRNAGFARCAGKNPSARKAIETSIRGKAEAVRLALVCLLARGHLLIEDVPGVGKTTLAQSLARAVDGSFHRLQFTSDMLPSDVLGVTVYNAHTEAFEFKPGPIFTNFLLADEINRTTPKTQSALLEAMNESRSLEESALAASPEPFMVIATQNPVEHHGTYPLPESQLDRFLIASTSVIPILASEREIVRQPGGEPPAKPPALSSGRRIQELRDAVRQSPWTRPSSDYMLAIVERTRHHEGCRSA